MRTSLGSHYSAYLVGDVFESGDQFGEIDIITILCLPIDEHGLTHIYLGLL